ERAPWRRAELRPSRGGRLGGARRTPFVAGVRCSFRKDAGVPVSSRCGRDRGRGIGASSVLRRTRSCSLVPPRSAEAVPETPAARCPRREGDTLREGRARREGREGEEDHPRAGGGPCPAAVRRDAAVDGDAGRRERPRGERGERRDPETAVLAL